MIFHSLKPSKDVAACTYVELLAYPFGAFIPGFLSFSSAMKPAGAAELPGQSCGFLSFCLWVAESLSKEVSALLTEITLLLLKPSLLSPAGHQRHHFLLHVDAWAWLSKWRDFSK